MINYLAHEASSPHAHSGSDGSTIIYFGILVLVIVSIITLAVYLLSRPEDNNNENPEQPE